MMMRRATIALTASFAALGMGCVDNDSTLFIRQAQAIDPANECVVEADPEAVALNRGFLDVGIRNTYDAQLLVGNQLVPRGDDEQLRTETGRVQLFEAEVEVFDFNGATISSFVQPISGFVDIGASEADPGYGIAGVTLVDPAAASAISVGADQTVGIVSRVRVFGETLGGLEVETGPWDFPISVCNCCTNVVNVDPEEDVEPVCVPGQDVQSIDSRILQSNPCGG